MKQVIGMLGVKGAGKDTCAAYLVSEYGFARVSFADALYREAANAFGVTVEFLARRETKEAALPQLCLNRCSDMSFVRVALATLGYRKSHGRRRRRHLMRAARSPRWVLQLWGTEYRRAKNENYWLDRVRSRIVSSAERAFVITDVRFLNEAAFVREMGGLLVRVRRPQLERQEAAQRAANGTAAHASETELADYPVDFEVTNEEGAPHSLLAQVRHIVVPRKAA